MAGLRLFYNDALGVQWTLGGTVTRETGWPFQLSQAQISAALQTYGAAYGYPWR